MTQLRARSTGPGAAGQGLRGRRPRKDEREHSTVGQVTFLGLDLPAARDRKARPLRDTAGWKLVWVWVTEDAPALSPG